MSDIAVRHGAETGQIARAVPQARAVQDSLILEVANIETDVLTGVYSEETGRPQPLRISLTVDLTVPDRYEPDTPLSASKNYLDLKHAATTALPEGAVVTVPPLAAVNHSMCEPAAGVAPPVHGLISPACAHSVQPQPRARKTSRRAAERHIEAMGMRC